MTDSPPDGRRLRRDRNRDAVVDAMLALYGEGNLAPSSDEIAARAGLSPRSLFRYFDDIDDLCRTAIARQQQRVMPFVDIDIAASAPLEARVAAVVTQRVQLFEAIGLVGQVSRLRAPFQEVIAAELRSSRAFLRRQLARVFPEVLADPRRLAAADVLCSFEAYRLLRDDQRLSTEQAGDVLAVALGLLVATPTEDE